MARVSRLTWPVVRLRIICPGEAQFCGVETGGFEGGASMPERVRSSSLARSRESVVSR